MNYIPPQTAIVQPMAKPQIGKKQLTDKLYDMIATAIEQKIPKSTLLLGAKSLLDASWKMDLFRDLYSMLWSKDQAKRRNLTATINKKAKTDLLLADYFGMATIAMDEPVKHVIITPAKGASVSGSSVQEAMYKLLKAPQTGDNNG